MQFAADTVRTLDLTGAGRNDYIIDLRNAGCPGREGAYCGTGGCELGIVATLPAGGTRLIFEQQVRDYEVLSGSGARTIRFSCMAVVAAGTAIRRASNLTALRHNRSSLPCLNES